MVAEPGPPDVPSGSIDPRKTPVTAEPSSENKAEGRSRSSSSTLSGMLGLDLVAIQARYSSIPLPDPEGLKQLQAIYPEAAEVIFGQMVIQSNHRIELEKSVASTNNTLALRGQVIGGLLGAIGLVGSFVAISTGHDTAGASVATGCVVTLAAIFVLGKNYQQKEMAAKAETRSQIARTDPPEKIASTSTSSSKEKPPKPAAAAKPKKP